MSDVSNYQELAMRTRGHYDSREEQLKCAALGLSGEAGEVAELIKKRCYHLKQVKDEDIVKELGDVSWYLVLCCDALGWDLQTVFDLNIEKLKKRYPDGFSYRASHERVDTK